MNQTEIIFIRKPVVLKMTGLPYSTLDYMIKNGTFPTQVKLSERSVAWVESEVKAWQQSLLSNRDDNFNYGKTNSKNTKDCISTC